MKDWRGVSMKRLETGQQLSSNVGTRKAGFILTVLHGKLCKYGAYWRLEKKAYSVISSCSSPHFSIMFSYSP